MTNVTGVLYGAIYSTLLTQGLKTLVIFVLNLAFGVPLAAVLAILSFVIGFSRSLARGACMYRSQRGCWCFETARCALD